MITKKRFLGKIAASPRLSAISSGLLTIPIILMIAANDKDTFEPFYRDLLATIGIFISLFATSSLILQIFYKNTIFISEKKQHKNFFTRNRDQIIVGLILLTIGYIIGKL